jgi:hypothetical protein
VEDALAGSIVANDADKSDGGADRGRGFRHVRPTPPQDSNSAPYVVLPGLGGSDS